MTTPQQNTPSQHLTDLDEIESALHELYVKPEHDGDYLVRFLGTQGEPGFRCLTLNLELRNEYFQSIRTGLDEFVLRIRKTGFVVDELLQKVSDDHRYDTRFWMLIYEADVQQGARAV